MSRRQRKGAGDRFIALPHWLMKSPAWRALSPAARTVLLHLWERHNGSNNGQIVYGVREAGKEEGGIGLSRQPAALALEELIELGFLRVTRDSSYKLKTKEARVWTLTMESVDGRPATRDFMRWTGPKSKPKPHRKTQSPQGDSAAGNKFKTQSPQGDGQSPQGDREPEIETLLPISVPLGGLKGSFPPASQSPQGDTSNLPCSSPAEARRGETGNESIAAARVERRLPNFGEAVRARRIARDPASAAADRRDLVAFIARSDAVPGTAENLAAPDEIHSWTATALKRAAACNVNVIDDAVVWDAWLNNVGRYAMRSLRGQVMLDACEAVEEARRAGSREATPLHIRKLLNDLDRLDRAERDQEQARAAI